MDKFRCQIISVISTMFSSLQILNNSPSVQPQKNNNSIISSKIKYKSNFIITNSFQTRHTFTYDQLTLCSLLKTEEAKFLLVFVKIFYFLHTHNYTLLTGICLLQIMQETLSFFMFLLQVKDKNAETKQD